MMTAVLAITYVLFLAGGLIERVLGPTGINVVTRLLGMLLAALAVQFVLEGLREFGFGTLSRDAGRTIPTTSRGCSTFSPADGRCSAFFAIGRRGGRLGLAAAGADLGADLRDGDHRLRLSRHVARRAVPVERGAGRGRSHRAAPRARRAFPRDARGERRAGALHRGHGRLGRSCCRGATPSGPASTSTR